MLNGPTTPNAVPPLVNLRGYPGAASVIADGQRYGHWVSDASEIRPTAFGPQHIANTAALSNREFDAGAVYRSREFERSLFLLDERPGRYCQRIRSYLKSYVFPDRIDAVAVDTQLEDGLKIKNAL